MVFSFSSLFFIFISSLQIFKIVQSEEWVVRLKTGQDPESIANQLGLKYSGPLRGPLGNKHHRFNSDEGVTPELEGHTFHKQKVIQRYTREESKRSSHNPSDPLYTYSWYYHGSKSIIDIESVWEKNITGRGIVITIIDDGVQHTHPDLSPNYLPDLSWDYNGNDKDPTPGNPLSSQHGTSCAGVAASVYDNNICTHGSAYDSKFAAIRLISEPETDATEAEALTHALESVDIYSCSWGPSDNGLNTSPAGALVEEALRHGTTYGRNGKGVIYMWAAGNGAQYGDNCNYDGLANSPYTIAVGAIDHNNVKSDYSESCASLFVTVPSSGDFSFVYSTSTMNHGSSGNDKECTTTFSGTSAATPLAAGIVALILQSNPNLSWREVQYILAETSIQVNPIDDDWMYNGAGYLVNHKYGFGTMNASKATERATNWNKDIGFYRKYKTQTKNVKIPIFDYDWQRPIVSYIEIENNTKIDSIEHVIITLSTTHSKNTDLLVILKSPYGTPSILAEPHAYKETPSIDWTSVRSLSGEKLNYVEISIVGNASYGPSLDYISGKLIAIDGFACTPLPPAPKIDETPLIALVLRGECTFFEKTVTVQNAGYSAIIIQTDDEKPVNMYSNISDSEIVIPSFMISYSEGEKMRNELKKEPTESGGNVEININLKLKLTKLSSPEYFFDGWKFVSVRHWGENPVGVWSLEIYDMVPGNGGSFDSWSLEICGSSSISNTEEDDSESDTNGNSNSVLIIFGTVLAIVVIGTIVYNVYKRKKMGDHKKLTLILEENSL